jgi:hypothetical protein
MGYAHSKRTPFLVHVTLHLALSRSYDPTQPLRWQGRLFDQLHRWLRGRRIPAAYGWVRERGRRKGDHVHLCIHLPNRHWKAFYDFMIQAGDFHLVPDRTDEPIIMNGGQFGAWVPTMQAGMTKYVLKSISPNARLDGVNILQALGVDHERSEPMHGLRAGLSRSLGRAARREGRWRERTTLAELRAITCPT